jgi:hypothetical protein
MHQPQAGSMRVSLTRRGLALVAAVALLYGASACSSSDSPESIASSATETFAASTTTEQIETTTTEQVEIAATTLAPASTNPADAPDRVLFIGDSFSWFFEAFSDLAASANPSVDVYSEVIWVGGALLSLHWSNAATLERVRSGDWDVVVLQEDVAEHWATVDQLSEYAGLFDEAIEASGAETVLYIHWPWSTLPIPSQEQITEALDATGVELDATVAPVGIAWQRAQTERPDLALYGHDGVHANPYGMYLAMCVFYATLFQRSPEGAGYRMADFPRLGVGFAVADDWTLSDDDAAFLQRIAWETAIERGLAA